MGSNESNFAGVLTHTYLNNNSFNLDQEMNGYWKGAVSLSYTSNSTLDMIQLGTTDNQDNGERITRLFKYQNSQFSEYRNLTHIWESSLATADFDNDGDLDLATIGGETSSNNGAKTILYWNNGSHFVNLQNLTGVWKGSIAAADYDNDGYIDLAVSGANESSSYVLSLYAGNGTSFVLNNDLTGLFRSSISFFDYDNDGDSDLGITGLDSTFAFVTKIYKNNISSLTPNSPPSPPTTLSSSYDGTYLNLTWNNGTDDLTPDLGLYYNLRVSTIPYQNDIVSGKYGGSSNPTQGYLGNMQQIRSILLNITENRTYFWQVQTIDNGLKNGSWSTLQEYDPCSSLTNVNVNCYKYRKNITENDLNVVSNTLTLFESNLTTNLINVNSTLVLNNSNINGNISISGNLTMDISNHTSTLFLYSDNINITNTNLSTISLTNSANNNLINTSFQSYSLSNASFDKKWKVTLTLNESITATVTVIDVNNNTETTINTTNGVATFYLIEKIYNDSGVFDMSNHTFTVTSPGYNDTVISKNITFNTDIIMNISLSETPIYTNFTNSLTTNFSNLSSFGNLENVTIGIPNKAQINFTQPVTVGGYNLDNLITIMSNHVSIDINSNNEEDLNKSATITMFNLSYGQNPIVLKDGSVCDDCTIVSYNGSMFIFNVTGFSAYTTTENSQLSLSESNKINQKPVINQQIYFIANYTNKTSGENISGIGNNCTIDFGNGPINMPFNSVTAVYEYNRTHTSIGTYNYNISCNSSNGYENLTSSSSVTILTTDTYLSLNQSLTGITKSSLVVGDIGGDGFIDLIISGNYEGGYIFNTYSNNNLVFILNQSLSGVQLGSSSLVDHNSDEVYDILIIGEGDSITSNFYDNK